MNIVKFSFFTLLSFSATANTANSVTFKNTTPFHLHLVANAGNCVQHIAPGASATISGYCGYDPCATEDFDQNLGCLEKNVNHSGLTQGGYVTYFGINTSPTVTCEVNEYVPYTCKIDTQGNFSLNYFSRQQKYSSGPQKGEIVKLPVITHYQQGPLFQGVNVSGLEYDGTFLDGMYQQPDLPDVRYFAEQGMNIIRLPIRWEFVLGSIDSKDPIAKTINKMYMSAVFDTVQKYLHSGLSVDLDLHNYMRFCPTGADVGQANEPTNPIVNNCQVVDAKQMAYIWQTILITPITTANGTSTFAKLAQQYSPKDENYSGPQLIFGLMNEPYTRGDQTVSTHTIFNNEAAAIKALRANGAPNNLIFMSGNFWDPLHGWPTSENASIFTQANLIANNIDPKNIAIEMHQYLDSDYSGLHNVCNHYNSYQDFQKDLGLLDNKGNDVFKSWIKNNSMKIFLGEFGAADNEDCRQDLTWLLQYVHEHAYDSKNPQQGGFIGWTAWRANRHGNSGFGEYTYLQQADNTVYGAPETGAGILQGPGNGLMSKVFAKFLKS